MRTSKISQDTTRIFSTVSANTVIQRRTRSAKRIASYSLGNDGKVEVKDEEATSDDESLLTPATPDIEDTLSTHIRSSRKRKLGADTPTSVLTTTDFVEHKSTWQSPRRLKVEDASDAEASPRTGRAIKAKPKIPARRTTSPNGTVSCHPPSNWEELYNIIHTMRKNNPIAPVDTMGCEDLFHQNSPPAHQRYHTLTALMLSSQTKDTVTAAAMQRLHTSLATPQPVSASGLSQSTLTIPNMLACSPTHLDSLICKVGFHNNKTRFIKRVAEILHNDYADDIPPTVEELIALPGVGPKMAYLCMSAAWGIDLGIGVDVHVHRITNLWGWHKTKGPEETRMWLEGWLPKGKWHEINKVLVGLGQTVCLPVGRRCWDCDAAGTGLCKAEIRGKEVEVKRRRSEVVKMKGEGVLKEEVEVKVEEAVPLADIPDLRWVS